MDNLEKTPLICGLFKKNDVNFTDMLNSLKTAVIILDIDCNVIYFNNCAESITGGVPEKTIGLACRYFLRTKHCIKEYLVNDKNKKKELETDILNYHRQIIPVKMSFSPLYDKNNTLIGFLVLLTDTRTLKNSSSSKSENYNFPAVVGKSPQMEKVFKLLPVLAQSDASILITGETGTGKDLLAEELHSASERSDGPFIKVNCGALPETLLESELFGHTKGAFTGAVENKPGRFKLAHNGTLFLTEIGDLPLTLQVKLLTFLDDKIIYPLGSTKGFKADVRIIAATHRNLEDMVSKGQFRQDLLFRLNVARISLPALREREDDIFLLLNHFLKIFNNSLGKNISGFTNEAKKILLEYTYLGNVREIKNIIEYAANVCQASKIGKDDLPAYISFSHNNASHNETHQEPYETKINTNPKKNETKISNDVLNSFSDIEKKLISDALLNAKGSKSKAADILGWGRTTLWRKMKKYKLS